MPLEIPMNPVVQLHPEIDPFEAFWKSCPLKVGKIIAKAKFDAITAPTGLSTRILDKSTGLYINAHLKATADDLIAAMRAYRQTRIDPNTYQTKPYTLHPATWLNSARWLDE